MDPNSTFNMQGIFVPVSHFVSAILRSEASISPPPKVDPSATKVPNIAPLLRTWEDDVWDTDDSFLTTLRHRKWGLGQIQQVKWDNTQVGSSVLPDGQQLDGLAEDRSITASEGGRALEGEAISLPAWSLGQFDIRTYQCNDHEKYRYRLAFNETTAADLSLLSDLIDGRCDTTPTTTTVNDVNMVAFLVHDGCVNRLCWSPDGTRLASGNVEDGQPHLVTVSDDCNLCISDLRTIHLGNEVAPPRQIRTGLDI